MPPAGTGGGGAQEHHTGRGLTLDGVGDRHADAGNAEEVALGLFDTLRDGEGDLTRLAVADAHETVAVAHDDERREAEAATALDDLRHTVDGDDALQELALVGVTPTAVTRLAALAASAARLALALGGRLGGGRLSLGSGLLGGHFGLLDFTHRFSPPSRAPSAIAATRPA